jgi:hypothetical protein
MDVKLNKIQTVSGHDLQKFFYDHDCTYQAQYRVDPECAYKITFWLDSAAYETKKQVSDTLKSKGAHNNRSCAFTKDNCFYICAFTPCANESLPEGPSYKETSNEEKKTLDNPDYQKILGVLSEKALSQQEIADKTGFSYEKTGNALKKLRALGKAGNVKATGHGFGEGRAPKMWVRGDG